ncbi:autophagy- protein 2 [Coelomomyces lativittatus]|nr:autophagy- protein 2 [Coelomomyces lativittatus]
MWMVDPSQISSTTSTALDTSGSKPTGRVDDSILLCKLEEPDKIGIEQTVFYSMLVESSILPTYTFSFQIFGWTWYVLSKLNPISETEIWETDSFLSSLLCIFSFEKCSLDVNNQKFEILQAQLSFPSVSKPFLEIPSLIFRKQGLYLPRLNLHYCSDEKLNLSDTTPRVWEKLFRCNSFVAAENLPENPSFFNFSNLDMFPFPTQFIIDINDIRVLYTSGPTSSMSDPIQFEISIAHISIPFSLKAPTLQFYDFQLKMNQTLLFKTSKDVPSTLSYSFKPISSSYLTSFTSLPSFRLTTGLSKLCVLSHIYCEFSTVDFYLYEAHFEFIRNLVSTRRSSSHPFHHAFHFHFRSFNCKDCFLHTEVKGESFNLCWSSFGFLLNVSKSNVYVPESSKCLETNVLALDLANGRFHAWYDQVNRSSHAHLSQCSLFLYPSVMEYLKKLCQTISRFKKVNSVDMESSYTGMPFLHYLSNTLFSPETFIPFSAYTKDLDVYLYPSFTEDCKCIHWNIEMGTLLLAVQPTLRLEVHQFVGSVYLDKYKWVEFQFSELFFIQLYLSTFPVQVYVDSPKLHLFFTPSTYQLAKRIVFFMTDYFLGNSETSTPISNPVPADNKQEEVAELLQSLLETTDPFPTTLDASSTSTEPLTLNKSSNLSISVVEDFATFEEHLDQTMVLLDTDLHLSTISEGSHSNHFMDLDIVENYFAEDTSEDCFADPTLFSPTSQENAMLRLRQANVVIYLNQEESTPIAEIYMEGHLETKRIEDLHWATRLKLIQVSLIDKCPSSTWHKLLTFEKHLYNVKIDWDWVRSEHRLVLNCQPMKLHLDQDTVQALMSFFSTMSPTSSVPSSLFFQRVEIYPINIKLDYKPKKVDFEDLQSGQFLQLLNFFHLEGAELVLQHAVFTGVHGIEELIHLLIMHWLPHIKNTQLGNMVSGVGPLRSFVNLGSGMVDLVLLPVSQYRKEGKVIKGLQRGAHSFVKTAAVETLNLGTKVSVGTYTLLRKADCFLENQPAPLQSAYAQQPKDLKEGIELAYKSISKNVSQVAKVLAMPIQTMERDKTGAMRQVLRAVPIAILKPMLGATEAMGKTLMGLRNTVDPSKKLESQDKYKPL